jgi:hypothetical protein
MNETNIDYTDCLNMPGIRRLFYVFKDSVLFMAPPRHINQWRIATINLKPDKKWGRIYFLPENTSFDENPQVTEQGDIYSLACSGLLLSTNELATTLLMALTRKELVLLIEDEKGNLRVLGNQNKGVKISISQSSSNIAGDVFGYQFGINFLSDGPAYWFNGEIEESEDGGELLAIMAAVKNSDNSFFANFDASIPFELPDQDIEVNGVNEGSIPSVGTIEVEVTDGVNPVTPNSVEIVGRKIEIEVPSGGGSYDLDLVDRFGNAFPTKQVTANATWDLRTLTPFDWFDLYVTKLVNPPTGAQLTALQTFFTDIIAAGIFAKAYAIYPIIGGTAADHKWNSRYPFDNESSPILQFIGSPTHNGDGVSTNGTSQLILTGIAPHNLPSNNKQISIYRRNQDSAFSENKIFGAGDNNSFRMMMSPWVTGNSTRYSWDMDTTQIAGSTGAATTDGLQTLRILAFNSRKYDRNASNIFHQTTNFSTARKVDRDIVVGGVYSSGGAVTQGLPVNCSYIYIGEALTDSQETDHYTIVQALQVALSRNI